MALPSRVFELLLKSTKELLRKVLKACRLNYEELQTVLLEAEVILNNRPLTYMLMVICCLEGRWIYLIRIRKAMISFHLRSYTTSQIVFGIGGERRRMKDDNRLVISVGDVVLVEEDKVPRFCWRMELVESLIYGKDGRARGAVVRVFKTHREISGLVNKLYPI